MQRLAALILMFGLFLTACEVTVITPDPDPDPVFPDTVDRTATRSAEASVDTFALDVAESVVYLISIPASVEDGRDLLYIELDRALKLEVFGSNDEDDLRAASQSSSFFASSATDLSALSPQGIGSTRRCGGSCAVLHLDTVGSQVFVRVSNQTGEGVEAVEIYAFTGTYGDTDEPTNDNEATAPTVTDFGVGALETLGDVDYFKVGTNGTLSMSDADVNAALDIRIEVINLSGTRKAILRPGDTTSVINTDTLRISSFNDRAAASGDSNYGFEIN